MQRSMTWCVLAVLLPLPSGSSLVEEGKQKFLAEATHSANSSKPQLGDSLCTLVCDIGDCGCAQSYQNCLEAACNKGDVSDFASECSSANEQVFCQNDCTWVTSCGASCNSLFSGGLLSFSIDCDAPPLGLILMGAVGLFGMIFFLRLMIRDCMSRRRSQREAAVSLAGMQ